MKYWGYVYEQGAYEIDVSLSAGDLMWLPDRVADLKAEVIFKDEDVLGAWTGAVTRTKAEMNDRTRTLPIVVEVNEPVQADLSTRMRPGMFVAVKIVGKTLDSVFLLPRHALRPGDVVYIEDNSVLRVKPVRVARLYKESVVIESGLSDGDNVIVSPFVRRLGRVKN